jgi:hypothetical protein
MRTPVLVGSFAVPVVVGLGVVGYAWWVVGLPPFSALTTAVVASTGILAVLAGAVMGSRWLPVRRGRGVRRKPGVAAWLILSAALVGWQAASWMQHPRHEHPTLSSLTNPALEPRPARMAAFLAWLAVAALVARR